MTILDFPLERIHHGDKVMFRIFDKEMPVIGEMIGRGTKGGQHCIVVTYDGCKYFLREKEII